MAYSRQKILKRIRRQAIRNAKKLIRLISMNMFSEAFEFVLKASNVGFKLSVNKSYNLIKALLACNASLDKRKEIFFESYENTYSDWSNYAKCNKCVDKYEHPSCDSCGPIIFRILKLIVILFEKGLRITISEQDKISYQYVQYNIYGVSEWMTTWVLGNDCCKQKVVIQLYPILKQYSDCPDGHTFLHRLCNKPMDSSTRHRKILMYLLPHLSFEDLFETNAHGFCHQHGCYALRNLCGVYSLFDSDVEKYEGYDINELIDLFNNDLTEDQIKRYINIMTERDPWKRVLYNFRSRGYTIHENDDRTHYEHDLFFEEKCVIASLKSDEEIIEKIRWDVSFTKKVRFLVSKQPREIIAMLRIKRFWRECTYNPIYSYARKRLID